MFIANSTNSYHATAAHIKPVEEMKSINIQAESIIKQFPEILWLVDDNAKFTHESQTSDQVSWSQALFSKKYIEFDRTLMTLFSLNCILNGSENAYE